MSHTPTQKMRKKGPEFTVQRFFKGKNYKQVVICLAITGLGRGIVDSKSRGDFCNFLQNHPVTVKK